jgi:hypothetical protein
LLDSGVKVTALIEYSPRSSSVPMALAERLLE